MQWDFTNHCILFLNKTCYILRSLIPNLFTAANLFFGCLAIVYIFKGNLAIVPYFTVASLVADFFDGFVARLLGVPSEMGKELDSLADMVSFGVVPGAILYTLLLDSHLINGVIHWASLGFILTVVSAFRLAKFNLDTRQTSGFIGLATPACSSFIISLIFFTNLPPYSQYLANTYLLLFLTALFSYLLIAEIPMFALKFKSYGWNGNQVRYLFIILSLGLFFLLGWLSVPLVIALYIGLSIFNNLVLQND